jgi:hypothetical protein
LDETRAEHASSQARQRLVERCILFVTADAAIAACSKQVEVPCAAVCGRTRVVSLFQLCLCQKGKEGG